ncbi:hypothetical protein [Nocardia implantans]|uniref:Transmembrane protein n=1 Tax=Nocardia implantans TaxID=3108168 RepID=A0ABU6AUG7_9NOCA|nr:MULTISPECIES: hypothetical protein [unclassified Nocardia]MBF6192663.1 hypothetical protein [Nocardia beijingensis]MEA3527429.1 hypothetical protein [Nocardia sp. CDC192]MEB3511137.1 hypothetical protein [Nocardia sp. CDC186]
MTYADVLTNAAVLDPHAWSDATVWTVALDATEARRRGRSSGSGGFSIGGLLLCIGVVALVIGLVIWLSKRNKSNQPQQQYPQQQYPQQYLPQQNYQGQQPQYPAPQYQQPYPPQGQQQYQQYPPQHQYPPQQPPYPPQR